jgi:hypothetical protein
MMQSELIRGVSHKKLLSMGILIDKSAPPLLEIDSFLLRPVRSIENRALAIYAFLLFVDGGEKYKGEIQDWLLKHQIFESLSIQEKLYISDAAWRINQVHSNEVWDVTEALYVLCWVLKKCPKPPLNKMVPDSLVSCLPFCGNQGAGWMINSPDSFRNSDIQDFPNVLKMLDLYYCLHWSTVEAGLKGGSDKSRIPRYAIKQRRLALEWVVSSDEWDDISLDT